MSDSSIPKFFEKDRKEKLEIIKNFSSLTFDEIKIIENSGGIGGGSDGDVRITIENITAAIIPAILNFLSTFEKLFKSY